MTMSEALAVRRVAWTDAVRCSVLSALGLALFCVLLPSIGLVLVTVGIPLLAVGLPLLRRLAEFHRRWAGRWLGQEIPSPYRPVAPANLVITLARRAQDPAYWRDLLWLLYTSTVGLVICLIAVVYGLFALLLWWLPPLIFLQLNARMARTLLSPSRSWYLTERVAVLAESRAEVVDVSAAEIRRIERDLHDGAQAKLVCPSGSTSGWPRN